MQGRFKRINGLGLTDGKSKYTISLTEWVRDINKKLEDGGMDTVFRIYDATKSATEKYLITHWVTIKEDKIAVWIEYLTTKGVKKNSADANGRA